VSLHPWRRRETVPGREVEIVAQGVKEWTRDEIATLLEKQAWARCRMSAADLLRSVREGTFEDPGQVSDLLSLAYLLPADGPLFAGW
jgi:hypothetical protein